MEKYEEFLIHKENHTTFFYTQKNEQSRRYAALLLAYEDIIKKL
jgi:hypothetical protein